MYDTCVGGEKYRRLCGLSRLVCRSVGLGVSHERSTRLKVRGGGRGEGISCKVRELAEVGSGARCIKDKGERSLWRDACTFASRSLAGGEKCVEEE